MQLRYRLLLSLQIHEPQFRKLVEENSSLEEYYPSQWSMAHVERLRRGKSLMQEDGREEVQAKGRKEFLNINRDLGFHRCLHNTYFWRGRGMSRLNNLGFVKMQIMRRKLDSHVRVPLVCPGLFLKQLYLYSFPHFTFLTLLSILPLIHLFLHSLFFFL